MMAGCSSGNKTKETNPTEQKLVRNDEGIVLYAPKTAIAYDASHTYGKLEHSTYYSKIAEKEKGINVLLPPNYTTEKKYPVLYILHGIFGDENSMVGSPTGGNCVTLSNMMNHKMCEEMIVVFPFMYTSKTQAQCTAIDEKNVACYDNFIDELTTSIMPYISSKYSVLEGRDNTAITGFSMGGREALACAFYKPELFGYVGSMCPAPGLVPSTDYAMNHPGQFPEERLIFKNIKPKLLMICGGDSDSVVGTFPFMYHSILSRNDVDHIWWLVIGSDHGDPAISSGIFNFAERLFK